MFRKTLAIIMVAVAAGLVGVLGIGLVAAQQGPSPSATRAFSPTTTVEPGDRVVVTITAANYGNYGVVTETLPNGFDYVTSSHNADQVSEVGQTVTFINEANQSIYLYGRPGTRTDRSMVIVWPRSRGPALAPPGPSPQRRRWSRATG